MDYKMAGLMAGIEIHQQLNTKEKSLSKLVWHATSRTIRRWANPTGTKSIHPFK